MNIFKKIFNKLIPEKINPPPIQENKKTLSEIMQFDDVYIRIDEKEFEGWVCEIKNNKIIVVYNDENNKLQETYFLIERPLNRNTIKRDNMVLILK